jgi:ribosomal-protein-alanine N-acetyltransferase
MTQHELAFVQETDIGMMARIHAASFDEVWSGVMLRRILSMPGTTGIAARLRRQWSVSGFALIRVAADESELLSLAVAPEHRGAGVGTLLLQGAIEHAREAGATRLFLEVAEDNAVARHLYEGHGLVPIGRRPEYYRHKDGSTSAAVTMSYDLASATRTPRPEHSLR